MIDKKNCKHVVVYRSIEESGGWFCTECGTEFFRFDTQPGKITFTPSPEPMPNIRDHFAMAALQGLMAANWKDCPYPTGYAEEAYKMADAMLKARSA
jgi:hypothetical protein